MFAPNQTTYNLADHAHAERLAHSARIHKVARERSANAAPVDRAALRRMTSRRLAAVTAGALLSVVLAAGALAMQADPAPAPLDYSNGGGVTLIR